MDLISLVVLAAEAAGEEESSKTAFYIGGGVFAAFAVVVGALGVTKPDFPGSDTGVRVVMAICVLLFAGAVGTAVLTS